MLLEADPVEIIDSAATDDGVNSIISALLFAAFIGLSILTIGVCMYVCIVYILSFSFWIC